MWDWVLHLLTPITKLLEFLKWIIERFCPKKPYPKRTLKIQPDGLDWSIGSSGGVPTMFVHARFFLTSTHSDWVQVARTMLRVYRRPCWQGRMTVEGHVLIQDIDGSSFGSTRTLYPNTLQDVVLDFKIKPPIRDSGESLWARVCFTDQFGNEHWTRKLAFRYR